MKCFIIFLLISLGVITDAKAAEWNPNNIIALDCALGALWQVYPGSPLPLTIQQKGITPDMTEIIEREKDDWHLAVRKQYHKHQSASAMSNYIYINGKIERSIAPKNSDIKEQSTFEFLQRISNQIDANLPNGLKVVVCTKERSFRVYYNHFFSVPKPLVTKQGLYNPSARVTRGRSYNVEVTVDVKTGELISWHFE